MGKCIRATAFIAIAATTSVVWGQAATPDLYDSTGKAVGQYKGDSVVISYNNQPVRIYTDAHWDYTQGRPVSSGLTWKYVPVYYGTANCSGQAYIGTAPNEPTAQGGNATPSAGPSSPAQAYGGPSYSAPAYGSQYLVATSRQGTDWTAYVSAQNPTYSQYPVQSYRQYDGSCAAQSYSNLWVTPVQTTVPLSTYGTPPFYAR